MGPPPPPRRLVVVRAVERAVTRRGWRRSARGAPVGRVRGGPDLASWGPLLLLEDSSSSGRSSTCRPCLTRPRRGRSRGPRRIAPDASGTRPARASHASVIRLLFPAFDAVQAGVCGVASIRSSGRVPGTRGPLAVPRTSRPRGREHRGRRERVTAFVVHRRDRRAAARAAPYGAARPATTHAGSVATRVDRFASRSRAWGREARWPFLGRRGREHRERVTVSVVHRRDRRAAARAAPYGAP
jgi:hypothetical protein